MGLIYMRISPSGGRYIGKTEFDEQIRWYDHINAAYNQNDSQFNTPLSKAIRKYGANNFIVEILENNIASENLSCREQYWIDYYKSYINDNQHGYNLTRGGEGSVLYNTEQILSLWNEGKSISEICTIIGCKYGAVIKRLQLINVSHEEITVRGYSIAQIKIQKQLMQKRKQQEENILKLWMQGYSQGQIIEKLHTSDFTVKPILIKNGVAATEIIERGKKIQKLKQQKLLQEKNQQRDLLILNYWNQGLNISAIHNKTNYGRETISRALKLQGINTANHNPPRGYTVLQYDLNDNLIKEWPSANAAAKALNIDTSAINKVCRGIKKTCGGFKWKRKIDN